MVKGIRERLSSNVNLFLSKANIYKEQNILLVEYIEKNFIKENEDYYIKYKIASEKEKVEDEDMEWVVSIFIERLNNRLEKAMLNKESTRSLSKVISLLEYKEGKRGNE